MIPRILALLAGLAAIAPAPVAAQTFEGRAVEIIDARQSAEPAPLILALHGALGSGAQILEDANFAGLATEFGLVVVGANGVDRRWLDGRFGTDARDVAYLSALIADLIARGLADPDAIYAVGHSNGGGMAMRMACDRPDLIAGIAVIATKVLSAYPCINGAPTPAIFFHGTNDRISPHAGRPDGARLGATQSSEASFATWAARNRCAGPAQTTRIDARPRDRTALLITRYEGCAAALMGIVIEGGGHGWPGSRQGPVIGGRITREVDAGRASLRFLLQ